MDIICDKTYTVAGHTFRIVAQEQLLDSPSMKAYSPFEVDSHTTGVSLDGQQLLFTLTAEHNVSATDATLILKDPKQRPEMSRTDVYHIPEGHLFELRLPFCDQVNVRIRINSQSGQARVALYGDERQLALGLNSAAMLCYVLTTAQLGTLLMHASVVINGGCAYLFLGRSGTGKSTHSRLWQENIAGSELMNDDHPVIRLNKQGRAIAYGSPWSGKTSCYRNISAPIGGIIRISRASVNSIHRLAPVAAYASLRPSSSGMSWEQASADGRDYTLQSIICTTPCWTMECLPDEEAAHLCAAAVRKKALCND